MQKINTGKFDVIEAKSMSKLKILSLLLKLSSGEHLNSDYVNLNSLDRLKIESEIPLICNIDGEIIKDNFFDFSIQKEAINYVKDDIGLTKYLKKKN